ncbi:E3 ubiquitin-protein ligase MARCH6, partial [Tremellales sp. Uapishka_1]
MTVYPEHIPRTIPITVYIRQTVYALLRFAAHAFRIFIAANSWLVILPSINMFTLRSLIWAGDHLAEPSIRYSLDKNPSLRNALSNSTLNYLSGIVVDTANSTENLNSTLSAHAQAELQRKQSAIWLVRAFWHPIKAFLFYFTDSWKEWIGGDSEDTFPATVFRGQILSIAVAASLLAFVLLREWVTQHNWDQQPQPIREAHINPDEWEIKDGIAKRTAEGEVMRREARAREFNALMETGDATRDDRTHQVWASDEKEKELLREKSKLLDEKSKLLDEKEEMLKETETVLNEKESILDRLQATLLGLPEDHPGWARQVKEEADLQRRRDELVVAQAQLQLERRSVGLNATRTNQEAEEFRVDAFAELADPVTERPPWEFLPQSQAGPSRSREGPPYWTPRDSYQELMPPSLSDPRFQRAEFVNPEKQPPTKPGYRDLYGQFRIGWGPDGRKENDWDYPISNPGTMEATQQGYSNFADQIGDRKRTGHVTPRLPDARERHRIRRWQKEEEEARRDVELETSNPNAETSASAQLASILARDTRSRTETVAQLAVTIEGSEDRKRQFEEDQRRKGADDERLQGVQQSDDADGMDERQMDHVRRGVDGGEDDSEWEDEEAPRTVGVRAEEDPIANGRNESGSIPTTSAEDSLPRRAANEPALFADAPLYYQERELAQLEIHRPPVEAPFVLAEQGAIGDQLVAAARLNPDLARVVIRNARADPDTVARIDGQDVLQRMEAGVAEAEAARQAEAEAVRLADEEEDAIFEQEDWDGILAVIGLVGPLHGLLQNIMFAMVVMSAASTLLIGLPINIGKGYLAVDLIRTGLGISKLLLRGIRSLTDPIVDILWEIIKDVIVLPSMSSLKALDRIISLKFGLSTSPPSLPSFNIASAGNTSRLGDVLALVGKWCYDFHFYTRGVSLRIALSHKVGDRIWCLIAGYAVTFGCISLIAIAGENNLGKLAVKVQGALKQYAVFFKLAFFMALELAIFPLAIGMVIDIFTIPLFPGRTVENRWSHLRNAPFSSLFVCWLSGTLFMFSFANLLSHIRTICRKGALFFIRDPADQNFSPVKDIIDRSSLSQLRKLLVSAIMYVVVLFWLLAVACWGIRYQPWVRVLPLRLDLPPLSSVPFDLLFLHLVLPPSWLLLWPYSRSKRMLNMWWKYTVSQYRLTSLLYGQEAAANESQDDPYVLASIWPVLDSIYQFVFGGYDNAATLARVPSADQVALLSPAERRKGGVFVLLDNEGRPKTENGKLNLLKQDKLAREAGRDPQADYTVVWLPRYWRIRIHSFIFSALVTTAFAIAVGFFVPLGIGRLAMGMVFGSGVHDGYNLLAGGYIAWGGYVLGRQVKKRIIQHTKAERYRRTDRSTRLKRSVKAAMGGVYSVVVLHGVLPLFMGLLVDLYVILPWKYGFKFEVSPVVHLWDTWAMGSATSSVFVGMTGVLISRRRQRHPEGPETRIEMMRDYIKHPLKAEFQKVNSIFLPLLGILITPILAPIAIVLLLAVATSWPDELYVIVFRATVPFALLASASVLLERIIVRNMSRFRQRIIDAEYVIEERVENYDAEKEKVKEMEREKVRGKGKAEEDGEEEWEDLEDVEEF